MIQITKANSSDSELIASIGKQSFLDSHGHSASKKDMDHFIAQYYTTSAIVKEFSDPLVHYHLINYNDKIVGFSKIVLNNSNANIDELNVTKLDRIYLLKEYHGLQLGSKLFNYTIQVSKKINQKGIWLFVWMENLKAVRFYTKLGFKIVGEYDYQISETHSNPNHIMYLMY